jgi:hypothetical protein
MDSKDWAEIYNEMRSVFERDKELTHIQVVFHIKPVVSEKKVAKIDIKTFRDEHRINR